MERKINAELLAPAGSLENLQTALYFGADAVYCGGPLLQLRALAAGMDLETLEQAIRYTHDRGKKLYVTVNCFAKNEEIATAGAYAKRLYEMGADAVIVSDLGVLAAVREACPDLPVHISTQANALNYKTVQVYASLGASRVVLGREMTLAQIEALSGRVGDTEIEVFVHGAMCMAYSGRCLLSSFLANRSGNRGECAQPCRWNYYLYEEKRPDTAISVTQADGAAAVFSSTDLNALALTDRLAAAGVASFKLEGRMKSAYYVATVVNAYRQYMDGRASLEQCLAELNCASHRPYAAGFYLGEAQNDPFNDGLYHADCTFIAAVLEAYPDGTALVEMRNRFCRGETLEIVSPHSMGLSFPVTEIVNGAGESVDDVLLVQDRVRIACPHPLCAGDLLRRRKSGGV